MKERKKYNFGRVCQETKINKLLTHAFNAAVKREKELLKAAQTGAPVEVTLKGDFWDEMTGATPRVHDLKREHVDQSEAFKAFKEALQAKNIDVEIESVAASHGIAYSAMPAKVRLRMKPGA